MEEPLFKSNVLAFALQHAEFEPDIEVCGLLGGPVIGQITAALPIANIEKSISKFRICENDLERGRAILTEQKLTWCGIYHSHVLDDAMPSKDDTDNMPWNLYYLIVSPKHLVKWCVYYKDEKSKKTIFNNQLCLI